MKAVWKFPLLALLAAAAAWCVVPSGRAAEPQRRTVWTKGHAEAAAPAVPSLSLATPTASGSGVGTNLRIINANTGCQDSEIGIGTSRNGRTIAVAANGDFVTSSQDGGANWSAAVGWPAGGGSTQGDPSVGVGLSGNVYLAYIWNNPAPSCDFAVSASTNQGLTFPAPVSAVSCPPSAGGCFPDQETLAVDQVNAGNAGDQLYLSWRQFTNVGCPNPVPGNQDASITCSQASGGAGTWAAPVLIDASGDRPRPAVAPDGTVYVVYVDGGDGGAVTVHRFTSCQNGLTPVAGYPYTVSGSSSVTGVPSLDRQGQEGNPMIGVDPYNSSLLYVVYGQDTSGDTSGDPGIFLQISTDAGVNWSAPIQINDNVTNNTSRYFPWIAVNPADGSVVMSWYDRRDDPANNDLTAFFGARVTGGGTANVVVSPNFRISQVDYAASNPGSTCGSPIYGDYNAVAAGPGFMYATWASPVSPPQIQPPSSDVDVFFAAIVAGDIPQIQPSGLLEFGDVCDGASAIKELTICNSGKADLIVNNITSSDPQFTVVGTTFPLVISPDACFPVQIQFTPSGTGDASANITILSNDPVNPTVVVVANASGTEPDLRVTGSTTFGDVCPGALAEKAISVCNVGACDLHVTSVAFDPPCPDFTLINNPFPATVSPDSCEQVVIRFTPTSLGSHSCTLKIFSDDPDTPIVVKTVTGNTPTPSIDVPPDQAFLPTVIQSIGSCQSANPFPVSNTGQCNLTITNFNVSTNPDEFSLSGLPSFPIILEPGHIAGEGDLDTVFAPDVLSRNRSGVVSVTYLSDPISNTTTTVNRAVCGEGVRTGARVLVTAGGVPMAVVEQIKLTRINANRNKNLLDTVDNARNVPLTAVTPTAPCSPFQYHREYGTVSNPIQLLPGSYQVTVTAIVNGRRVRKTVGFDVQTCGFNPNILVSF